MKQIGIIIGFFALFLMLSACVGSRRPAILVEQYMLEYSLPKITGLSPSIETLRIDRFSVDYAYNSQEMVYRTAPFKRDVYQYHRWRVNPGDMVTDYLLRDLKGSGLFKAVFSYRDIDSARFFIEGGVQEFLQVDDNQGSNAVLKLTVTLFDLSQKELAEKIMFQRQYQAVQAIDQKTPLGFAQAMSKAMGQVSQHIIEDVHHAVKEAQ
jgi:cholesterol transport system auxiliary component